MSILDPMDVTLLSKLTEINLYVTPDEKPCKDGLRADLRQLPVQEHPGPPETEQGKEVPSRKPSEGERFQ